MWIAIDAGINHRGVRPLDKIHERVPQFDQLTTPRNCNGRPTGPRGERGNVIKLPTRDALAEYSTESSLIALAQHREVRPRIGPSDLHRHVRHGTFLRRHVSSSALSLTSTGTRTCT